MVPRRVGKQVTVPPAVCFAPLIETDAVSEYWESELIILPELIVVCIRRFVNNDTETLQRRDRASVHDGSSP